ncbi:MAG: acetolactate synthase small subunit [Candidatus Marinimicrobia bacterium]|nr:acetolactate synthase small subunit [Candidatus Neomarinimicrobiota bacterium]
MIKSEHTIVAFVEDEPGVLNRVVSLLRRRNYNIKSLVVGATEQPGLSRMTIVTDESDNNRRVNMARNIQKLVNAYTVEDVTDVPAVIREYMLAKVSVSNGDRVELDLLTREYGAKVIDSEEGAVIIEATGYDMEIESFIQKLKAYDIVELMRSGKMAMRRGSHLELKAKLEMMSTDQQGSTSQIQSAIS